MIMYGMFKRANLLNVAIMAKQRRLMGWRRFARGRRKCMRTQLVESTSRRMRPRTLRANRWTHQKMDVLLMPPIVEKVWQKWCRSHHPIRRRACRSRRQRDFWPVNLTWPSSLTSPPAIAGSAAVTMPPPANPRSRDTMIEGQLDNWCLAKSIFGVNEIERGDGSGEKIFDDVLTSEPVNTYGD